MAAPQFSNQYLAEFRDLLNAYLREVDQRLEGSEAHQSNANNPHSVTRAQLGAAAQAALDSHTATRDNPHAVTAAQAGAPPTSRTISTTAPLSGGGNLGANRTLSITPASQSAAGSMSAADKGSLDKLVGAHSNIGAFHVYQSSATTVPHNSFTRLQFHAREFDSEGWFDLAANQFKPQRAGYYYLVMVVYFTLPDGCRLFAIINGRYLASLHTGTSDGIAAAGAGVFYANGTTDTFVAQAFQNSASTQPTSGDHRTWFAGIYLGDNL